MLLIIANSCDITHDIGQRSNYLLFSNITGLQKKMLPEQKRWNFSWFRWKKSKSETLIGCSFQDTVLSQNKKFLQNKAKTIVYQKVQCIYKQPVLSESLSARYHTFILICKEFWHKVLCFYLQKSLLEVDKMHACREISRTVAEIDFCITSHM